MGTVVSLHAFKGERVRAVKVAANEARLRDIAAAELVRSHRRRRRAVTRARHGVLPRL